MLTPERTIVSISCLYVAFQIGFPQCKKENNGHCANDAACYTHILSSGEGRYFCANQCPASDAHIVDARINGHCHSGGLRCYFYDAILKNQIENHDCNAPEYTQREDAEEVESQWICQ